MNKKTQAAYQKIVSDIADEGAKLSRGEYIDLVQELAGHIRCLQDCIDEEEGGDR